MACGQLLEAQQPVELVIELAGLAFENAAEFVVAQQRPIHSQRCVPPQHADRFTLLAFPLNPGCM